MEHNPKLSQPQTPLEYLRIYLTGFAMGAADIVPGVSGGTMAFILGIYENLLNAIKSFNLTAIRLALGFKVQEFVAHTSLRFVIALGVGILSAVFLLANLLGNLLETQPLFVFAFFGGLILASIVAIGVRITWNGGALLALAVGAALAFLLVGLAPLENADHSPAVLFISGAIAICAMILPGISGSFILLVLGQYRFVLDAVRALDFVSLGALALGCVVGLLAFARVLSYALKHYPNVTVATLVGIMLGSLRKIWEEAVEGGLGTASAGDLAATVGLLVVGFVVVSLLDHLQTRDNPLFRLLGRRQAAA